MVCVTFSITPARLEQHVHLPAARTQYLVQKMLPFTVISCKKKNTAYHTTVIA